MTPLATYRLQLTPDFGFDDAAAVLPYLADLGVTHLYTSPYLQAAPGSTHGYDVVDHNRVNEELGGATAHRRMVDTLATLGLGQVIDVVPNHMAIGSSANHWWWDVLEHGPASWFAGHFDVDWDGPDARLRNRILVPVLGEPYGRALEGGQLDVEREGARLRVRYAEHRYPLSPRSVGILLADAAARARSAELALLADTLAGLPEACAGAETDRARRQRDIGALYALVERLVHDEPSVAGALDDVVAELNANTDRLDALLAEQHYRLAHWRVASEELDYRRFFDITTLAGVRVEQEEVFDDTHRLLLQWCASGEVDGLRIDHPDGLRDPEGYLTRLAAAAPDAWIVVEKILEGTETLPGWPVAGTTGYDFLNVMGGLFVDPAGEDPMTRLYRHVTGDHVTGGPITGDQLTGEPVTGDHVTGEPERFDRLVVSTKRQVLRRTLAADLTRLARLAAQVAAQGRHTRDLIPHDLRLALEAVLVHFPVYRTYARPGEPPSGHDIHHVDAAVTAARDERPEIDPAAFDFVTDALLGRLDAPDAPELAARFQQLASPVMAKGVEDTAFYRYHRLVALNEVGGDPTRFGLEPDDFHRHNLRMVADWPATMTSTATHDTKRSEDVRARLALLSEIPAAWAGAVGRWSAMNAGHRRDGWPEPNTEYLLYQTLVGAHPLPAERARAYMEKATREAKVHTSWTDPDARYDSAVAHFVDAILGDEAFAADLDAFVAPLVAPGRVNSLAQTVLKLMSPGVPDIYQGTELWDDSLVDPDNRRPVDFEARRRLLAEVDQRSPEQLLARADGGLPKLAVVRRGLAVRHRLPHCFLPGPGAGYRPLTARGAAAGHLVGFARGEEVVVLVPRLVIGLEAAGGWGDTTVELPEALWTDELSGERWPGGTLAVGDVLARFPAAILTRDASAPLRGAADEDGGAR